MPCLTPQQTPGTQGRLVLMASPGRTRTCNISVNSLGGQNSKCCVWCRLRKTRSHSFFSIRTQSCTQIFGRCSTGGPSPSVLDDDGQCPFQWCDKAPVQGARTLNGDASAAIGKPSWGPRWVRRRTHPDPLQDGSTTCDGRTFAPTAQCPRRTTGEFPPQSG